MILKKSYTLGESSGGVITVEFRGISVGVITGNCFEFRGISVGVITGNEFRESSVGVITDNCREFRGHDESQEHQTTLWDCANVLSQPMAKHLFLVHLRKTLGHDLEHTYEKSTFLHPGDQSK